MIKHFLASLIMLSVSSVSFAEEGVHTSIHRHYQSIRALGMGGAFTAVADDYNALFYNPAGLARLEEGQVNASIEAGMSAENMQKLFKDIETASQSSEDANTKLTAINQALAANYGKQYSMRFGLLEAIWARPGFGFGFIPADFTMDVKIHQNVVPALNLRAFLDTTLALGYGSPIKTEMLFGKLSWGITTKFINRGYTNKQANGFDLTRDPEIFGKKDLRWGYTADVDIGFLYSPVVPTDGFWSGFTYFRPTFGLVGRNLVDSGFGQAIPGQNAEGVTIEPPEKLQRVFDFGTKWELPAFWIFSWRLMADIQDMGHTSFNFRKGFHFGAEFDWKVSSWWKGQYRIGANQGYPTLGANFLLGLWRLDLATYGEDVGGFSNPKENRVYALKMNLDF